MDYRVFNAFAQGSALHGVEVVIDQRVESRGGGFVKTHGRFRKEWFERLLPDEVGRYAAVQAVFHAEARRKKAIRGHGFKRDGHAASAVAFDRRRPFVRFTAKRFPRAPQGVLLACVAFQKVRQGPGGFVHEERRSGAFSGVGAHHDALAGVQMHGKAGEEIFGGHHVVVQEDDVAFASDRFKQYGVAGTAIRAVKQEAKLLSLVFLEFFFIRDVDADAVGLCCVCGKRLVFVSFWAAVANKNIGLDAFRLERFQDVQKARAEAGGAVGRDADQ